MCIGDDAQMRGGKMQCYGSWLLVETVTYQLLRERVSG
jgi:hypothetical protein